MRIAVNEELLFLRRGKEIEKETAQKAMQLTFLDPFPIEGGGIIIATAPFAGKI